MKKRIGTKIKSLTKEFGIDLQVKEHNDRFEIYNTSCVLINDISEGEVFAYLCGMHFALKHLDVQVKKEKVIKHTHWHGLDIENAVNIFENGLVIRWVPKQHSWQTIYKYPSLQKTFGYGWVNEQELSQIFIDGWACKEKDAFLSFHGITWSEYMESSVIQKASDVYDYFGAQNLFGVSSEEPETVKQICKRLKIKYDKNYEN